MEKEALYAHRARKIIKNGDVSSWCELSYLSQLMGRIGLEENEASLKTKINRGRFSFLFFLQVMDALGMESLDLQRYIVSGTWKLLSEYRCESIGTNKCLFVEGNSPVETSAAQRAVRITNSFMSG